MPVYTAPAEIDMFRVIRQNEGGGVSSVVGSGKHLLLTKGSQVAGFSGDTVVETWFVSMAGIKYHDSVIREHNKRRIVMVIRLEP